MNTITRMSGAKGKDNKNDRVITKYFSETDRRTRFMAVFPLGSEDSTPPFGTPNKLPVTYYNQVGYGFCFT